ncbi:hypothetical protein [Streptomyces sp. NPDC002067]
MTWPYDLYICDTEHENLEDHGDACDVWRHGGTWFDYGFRHAFRAAARQTHAYVRSTSPYTEYKAVVFKHIKGGGQCEQCGPATGRRGPWTRSLAFERFLCAECARGLQAASDGISKATGVTRWRSVRPVIEDAEL